MLRKACLLLIYFFNLFSGMIEPVQKALPQALFAEGESETSLILVSDICLYFSFYDLLSYPHFSPFILTAFIVNLILRCFLPIACHLGLFNARL